MKLHIDRNTLLEPLQMIIGVVEKKQALPILSNVLVTTKEHKIELIGTDTEVELIGHMPLLDNKLTQSITLPGRKLIDICRSLPEDSSIEISLNSDKVHIKSGRSQFTLTTLPANEFPSLEVTEIKSSLQLAQNELLRLFQQTYISIAQQDVRYYLNGLLFETHPNLIRAVATDGHRLAMSQIAIPTQQEEITQTIIPRKGIIELMRLLDNSETPVTINIGDNFVQVIGDNFTFKSKLIEGRFPDYNRVIPRNGNKLLSIDRETLKKSLARTAILCNEKFKGVRINLSSNLLLLTANNPEHETATEELAVNYDGEPVEIGFNVIYLLDILNTIKTNTVKLTLTNSNSSVLLEEDPGDGQTVFVVMPMRL